LLKRLNDLAVFDAARWPAREVVGRILGGLLAIGFISWRLLKLPNSVGYIREVRWAWRWFSKFEQLPDWLAPPGYDFEGHYFGFGYSREQVTLLWTLTFVLWLLITCSFIAYIIAYLTRARAQSVAKGFTQTFFPVLVAGLPFLTTLTSYTYRDWFPEKSEAHLTGMVAILSVLIAGGALQLVSLLTLRRGFTIMSEARVFIRTGLYRWVRHPVYASHFLIYFCYTLVYFHALTVVMYVAFVAGQTIRARIEERKLTAAFPEYEEYRKSTGMFLPKFW